MVIYEPKRVSKLFKYNRDKEFIDKQVKIFNEKYCEKVKVTIDGHTIETHRLKNA